MNRLPKKYFKSITDYVMTYYTADGVTKYADKLYNAVKTVTKDFTRTDPVYVRIGEDGEPEIHYNMSNVSDATDYFKSMNIGNASLYCHGCGHFNVLRGTFSRVYAKRISIDSLASLVTMTTAFLGISGPDDGSATIDMPSDTTSLTSIIQTFAYGPLYKLPLFDISGIKNIYDFILLYHLTEIPAYDFSNVTSFGSSFTQCGALTSFRAYGMKASFTLSDTALKHDAILEVFNNLGSGVAEGTTLTLGETKLALMSDDEKKIATDKGWTLA